MYSLSLLLINEVLFLITKKENKIDIKREETNSMFQSWFTFKEEETA
jgi:hypothetical protein